MNRWRALVFFLAAAALWAAPQQVTITSANKAVSTLPSSSAYSTLATFRVEWRVTMPVSASASPAWSIYPQTSWSINNGGLGYVVHPYIVTAGSTYSYLFNDHQESTFPQFSCPNLNFGQETVVRFQKFPTVLTCETWNVDGTNYQQNSSVAFVNVPGLSGPLQIGDATYNHGTWAFFRGYSGNVALNSKPPFGASGGDLWDYEFNGNLNDSSGHNLTMARTGTFTYSVAATYPPACLLPPQTTFRAGTPVTTMTAANSFPLDGGQTLTYQWQQLPSNLTGAAPSVLQLSSLTNVNLTLQGLIAGSYVLQLTVTDSSGVQSTCSTKYGAVATDANGSVIIANPVHAQILGPIIASFASPWAAEPAQHTAYAQLMIQKLAGTSTLNSWFIDYWNQPQTGTVTVSNGSQAVIGSGTSFTTTFCQGPANPTVPKIAGNTTIVIWYPILNPDGNFAFPAGTTGRRFGTVSSCTDDTHLTASFLTGGPNNWVTDAYVGAGSGLSYAYVEQNCLSIGGPPNCVGGWATGNAPANYYDNVKALYAEYYRTGIDDYLIAARTMADRFWSYPAIDKGITYETSNTGSPWASIAFGFRSLSVTGLMMRNADNPPYDYGPGIRSIINYLLGSGTPNGSLFTNCSKVGPTITNCGQDVREQSYALSWVALDAMFDSNSAQVALDLAAISRDMTNRWGQCQANGGICVQWDTITGYYVSWPPDGANFTATVTNGSNIITANGGGTWDPTKFTSCATPCSVTNAPNAIWITSTGLVVPSSNAQGDGGWYYVVYHSPTQLYLTDVTGQNSVIYTGTTKSAAGWQTITFNQAQNNPAWLGFYWQPYMTGILNQAYWYVAQVLAVSDPVNAANAAAWAVNNANAMATMGLNAQTQGGFVINGPYYAIGITCPGNSTGIMYPGSFCDSALLGDRELNSETLNVATIAYRFNPASQSILTLGNTMTAAIFAQPGEPFFDGANVLRDLVNPGFLYTTSLQHKWLGAFWGVGSDWAWASVRLGGLRPPIQRVVDISLNFQRSTQAVLTVLRPDGTTSQYTCTSSPCPVTIDSRQGDHIVSIKYLNATNQVLLPPQSTIVKAQ